MPYDIPEDKAEEILRKVLRKLEVAATLGDLGQGAHLILDPFESQVLLEAVQGLAGAVDYLAGDSQDIEQ